MRSTASLAPPCAGPHKAAMPEAMHANGFAPELPARRTVEVLAFCSWSACRMKIKSSDFSATGSTSYSSLGFAFFLCCFLLVLFFLFLGLLLGLLLVCLLFVVVLVGFLVFFCCV